MYRCQACETIPPRTAYSTEGAQRVEYRVELAADGLTAIWKIHCRGIHWRNRQWLNGKLVSAARYVRAFGDPCLPWINGAAHGRKVTKAQAMKLTGLTLGAAALDFLVEQLQNGPTLELQNYQAPKKTKSGK